MFPRITQMDTNGKEAERRGNHHGYPGLHGWDSDFKNLVEPCAGVCRCVGLTPNLYLALFLKDMAARLYSPLFGFIDLDSA